MTSSMLMQSLTYTYDPVGNPVEFRFQQLSNALVVTYGYDAKERLLSAHYSGAQTGIYTYSYDAVDNMLHNPEQGLTMTYDLATRLMTGQDASGTASYT